MKLGIFAKFHSGQRYLFDRFLFYQFSCHLSIVYVVQNRYIVFVQIVKNGSWKLYIHFPLSWRHPQVLVAAMSCGFKSRHLHHQRDAEPYFAPSLFWGRFLFPRIAEQKPDFFSVFVNFAGDTMSPVHKNDKSRGPTQIIICNRLFRP